MQSQFVYVCLFLFAGSLQIASEPIKEFQPQGTKEQHSQR